MKYRKKPVEVEAMRLVGDAPETFKVCDWMVDNGYPWLIGNALEPETLYDREKPLERPGKGIWIRPEDGALMIRTLEGDMEAPYGWWIIKGVKGEFYSCRDDIFQETYEEVTPFDADGIAESIEYNKRVYDTFRGGEDGMLGVREKTVTLHSKRNGGILLQQLWKTNDGKFILTEDPIGDSWSNSSAYWVDESGHDPGDAIAVSGHLGYLGCLESLGYTILDDH